MVRREVFDAVGGFDEEMVVSGGDVDLCLRIHQLGLRILNTPYPRLVHHESVTRRNGTIPDSDAWLSFLRFREFLEAGDPFWNPNLSLTHPDCRVRTDPRSAIELAGQMLGWDLPSSRAIFGS